jgi:hypothetical protein
MSTGRPDWLSNQEGQRVRATRGKVIGARGPLGVLHAQGARRGTAGRWRVAWPELRACVG